VDEVDDELHPAAARPIQAITSSGRRQPVPGFVFMIALRSVTSDMQ
jgi:hypothetical protein